MLRLLVMLFLGFCSSSAAWSAVSELDEHSLSLPPVSLKQWYKPENKRQVWLHTMFGMRRELQAIAHYAKRGDEKHLKKWFEKFSKHYRSIGEMVPEWSDELDLEMLAKMETSITPVNAGALQKQVRKLGHSCKSCHREYRAIVAATYRAPDFRHIEVVSDSGKQSFKESMNALSGLVNSIKIASDDGEFSTAVENTTLLGERIERLGESCRVCHKEADGQRERYLGSRADKTLTAISEALKAQRPKDAGRLLGTFAVNSCARCHSVHRSLYDLKVFFDQ